MAFQAGLCLTFQSPGADVWRPEQLWVKLGVRGQTSESRVMGSSAVSVEGPGAAKPSSRTSMEKVLVGVGEENVQSREERIGRGRRCPLSSLYPACLGYAAHQRRGKEMSAMRDPGPLNHGQQGWDLGTECMHWPLQSQPPPGGGCTRLLPTVQDSAGQADGAQRNRKMHTTQNVHLGALDISVWLLQPLNTIRHHKKGASEHQRERQAASYVVKLYV